MEIIAKWLRDSGLKVNEEKTDLCLFHRYDHHPISISMNERATPHKYMLLQTCN